MTDESRAEALDIAANFLDECQVCGVQHSMSMTKQPATGAMRMTWADPEDGHLYRRRGSAHSSDVLRTEASRLRGEEGTPS